MALSPDVPRQQSHSRDYSITDLPAPIRGVRYSTKA
ncbi:MAG: hypothetical protein RL022_1520 [Chloroflexota bacterium]|jgi:hypothetical protein